MIMSRRAVLIIVCLAVLLMPSAVYAADYSDEEAGVEFTVPEGWSEDETFNDEVLKVKYVYDDTKNTPYPENITCGYADLWEMASEEDRACFSREDCNNSLFTAEDMGESLGFSGIDVGEETYGGIQYFVYQMPISVTLNETTIDANLTCMMRIYNGYEYIFQYCCRKGRDDHYGDFEKLVASAEYTAGPYAESAVTEGPAAGVSKTLEPLPTKAGGLSETAARSVSSSSYTGYGITAREVILGLILTIVVYTLPILIYRCAIRKRPVEKKKAKWIAIIYGICITVIMIVIIYALGGEVETGYAAILWSCVNYAILTGGNKKNRSALCT